jgi:hypothetical protein
MGVANETGIAIGGAVVPPIAVYLAYLGGGATTPLSLLLLGLATAGLSGLLVVPRRGGSRHDPALPERARCLAMDEPRGAQHNGVRHVSVAIVLDE